MYDPKLEKLFSTDNCIQDPFNTQNYNRYDYVLNNPQMYTDLWGDIEGKVIKDFVFKGKYIYFTHKNRSHSQKII